MSNEPNAAPEPGEKTPAVGPAEAKRVMARKEQVTADATAAVARVIRLAEKINDERHEITAAIGGMDGDHRRGAMADPGVARCLGDCPAADRRLTNRETPE